MIMEILILAELVRFMPGDILHKLTYFNMCISIKIWKQDLGCNSLCHDLNINYGIQNMFVILSKEV